MWSWATRARSLTDGGFLAAVPFGFDDRKDIRVDERNDDADIREVELAPVGGTSMGTMRTKKMKERYKCHIDDHGTGGVAFEARWADERRGPARASARHRLAGKMSVDEGAIVLSGWCRCWTTRRREERRST